jgi:SAM-dependent methyltransferase
MKEQYTSSFSDDQYEKAYPDGIKHHWWTAARNIIIKNTIESFPIHAGPILEIGCGKGIVVEHLRNNGIDCDGVELADAQVLKSIEGHITTVTDAIMLPENQRHKYQTILLLDVIEHLENPIDFLKALPEKFVNLSKIVITVPARQELWSNYDSYHGHYRRYSLEDLDDIANTLKWQVDSSRYFFHCVYIPAWILTKLNVARKTDIRAPTGIQRIFHKIICYIMIIEDKVSLRRLKGTSAIAYFSI